MKNSAPFPHHRLAALLLLAGVLAISCSKKETTTATSTAAATPEASPTTSAAAGAPPAPALGESSRDVDARIAEAQAAMKARDYERAAAALAAPRQTPVPMTGQQLMNINSAQANLVNQLAAAAAAGDPKAKATLEMLRQRALNHQ